MFVSSLTHKTIKMKDYYYKEEAELAVKWFEINDIPAYIDTDGISVYVVFIDAYKNDIHILISGSELSHRADLYKEHLENLEELE